MSKPTQAERILEYMREHPEGITPITALDEFGCFRLGARIYDLRREGHQITAETHGTATGKSVARYRLTGITQTPRTVQSKEGVQSVGSSNAVLSPPEGVKSVLSHTTPVESKEDVKTPQPTVKLRLWVCAQCGAPAAYIGSSTGGDAYGIGKCFKHGRTAVMAIYKDVGGGIVWVTAGGSE